MNSSKLEQLERLAEEGYEFDFPAYITQGFELFKHNIGGYVGFLLVFWLIGACCNSIPVLGTLAFSLVLSPAIMVGGFIVAHKIHKREMTEFADFFKGFEHLTPLVFSTVVMSVFYMLFGAPFLGAYWDMMNGDTMAILNYEYTLTNYIVLIPIIYLGISWSWTSMFIVFYDMPFWDAMEMSRKIITRNWLLVFAFLFICGIITTCGVLLFGFGVLFTYPIAICAQYVAFAEVTQLLDHSDEDELERHLIV